METPATRLKRARIEAGFRTARIAAESLGIAYPTYAGHENGYRAFDSNDAIIYAKRFKVPLEWLLTGKKELPAFIKPQDGSIQPGILRLVIVHLATEHDDIINADPQKLADVIIDLCDYLQATNKPGLEKAESDLAMRRMKENARS
jgi:hypothetical protein